MSATHRHTYNTDILQQAVSASACYSGRHTQLILSQVSELEKHVLNSYYKRGN